ncbi:MAG: hypothetical protein ACT4OX_11680 [Actinomycetota bacterium]
MNDDPVLLGRARAARIAAIGKRIGYSALLASMVAFFVGVATNYPTGTVAIAVGGLVVACVVLPIPIVVGYGVRAAAREDRERS